MMKQIIVILSLLFPLSLQGQCPGICNPFTYEGFNYADLTPLHEQQGGTGWNDAWVVQNDNITVPGYHISTTESIPYMDLQSTGGTLNGGSQYDAIGRLLDVSEDSPYQNIMASYNSVGAAGSTLYFSFKIRIDQYNGSHFGHMHNGTNPTRDNFNGAQILGAGVYGSDSDVGGTIYWTLRVFNNYYPTNIPLTLNEDVLIVLRAEMGANDNNTYSIWVNPSTIGATMPTPDLVQAISGQMSFRSIKFYLNNVSGANHVDEVRVADSYECATPDAVTALNQLPQISMSNSSMNGNAPHTVSFDASSSTDSDGSIVNYEWHFGDGETATGPIVNHQYDITGNMTGHVIATDNCGAQNATTFDVAIADMNGNFPCQSVVQLERMADWSTDNGRIEAFGGDSYTLTYPDMSQTTQANGTFVQLAQGDYELVVSSNGGTCTDTFNLVVPLDSNSIPGWSPNPCLTRMGMNIDPLNYWNSSRHLKDYARQAGYFRTFSALGNTEFMDSIPVDASGYPLELPFVPADGSGDQYVRSSIASAGHMLPGDYVLTYDGDGIIAMSNSVNITQNIAGRIEFNLPNPDGVFIRIFQSTIGNHIRNIHIFRTEDESTYQSAPFNAHFLDKLNHFEVIRFMEAQDINEAEQVDWIDRKPANFYSEAFGYSEGVSYEFIIELANLTRKDIWVNVPHAASDDYITQMATFFRDNLHPDVDVYIEYSNEVWNFFFPQTYWVLDRTPSHWSYERKYAQLSKNVFDIWKGVWTGQEDRIKTVLGTWLNSEVHGMQGLAYLKGEVDYIAPTWYFGSGCSNNIPNGATVQDVLDCAEQSLINNMEALRAHTRNAKMFGVEIITYEGGQHLVPRNGSDPNAQAIYDAQIHPSMYDLYQRAIDSLRVLDNKLIMPFTLSSWRESQFGSWGALEYIEQDASVEPAPKWEALLDNIVCYTPPVNLFLPVELLSFRAQCGTEISFAWSTLTEQNSSHFEVEMWQGNHWITLGEIEAAGHTAQIQYYEFEYKRNELQGTQYFRLKMVDLDGTFEYSDIIPSQCGKDNNISIHPNPTHGMLQITSKDTQSSILEIYNVLSQKIISLPFDETSLELDLNTYPMTSGTYFLFVRNDSHIIHQEKIIYLED